MKSLPHISDRPIPSLPASETGLDIPARAGQGAAIRPIELPTVALGLGLYATWIGLTLSWSVLPLWLVAPLLAVLLCWHQHFQHECLHGHPTRITWLNTAFAHWPIQLWVPYLAFKRDHMVHHRDEHLTEPLEDPESFFVDAGDWARTGPVWRRIRMANMTLLGRLTLGPILGLAGFWRLEIRRLARGDAYAWKALALYLAGLAAMLAYLTMVAEIPLWLYLLAVVYPGAALANVRTFAEHRLAEEPGHRTAIVENTWPFGVLFLFNNLHIVHHTRPGLPWYAIPEAYRLEKDAWQARNGAYVLKGYRRLLRYLVRPIAAPPHPGYAKRHRNG
ncbi:MAG: fatty acid desaturase [Alphaproteobacteria bacterium]|nr:fatty acid desaturase [Alphaproteobacteria bacterium]